MIVWLENLNLEMACLYPREEPDYVLTLYILSEYCWSVNKFMDENLITSKQEYIEAIKQFYNYVLLIGDLSALDINKTTNSRCIDLIKTLKRCSGILKQFNLLTNKT